MTDSLKDEKQKACDVFNAKHPVGSRVRAWTGVKGDGPGRVGTVRWPAQVLSGHTPVVWINGISGCVALTHVVSAAPGEE